MHLFLALLLTHPSPVPLPPSRLLDTARAQEDVLLRVLAINDLHGALEPQTWPWSGGRAVGGAPALKAWFDTLSRACHCTTVRLDGGDEMQGTLLSNFGFGRAAVAALNTFGIDAAAIGNHEFDWSVDTLRARMAEAHYRFLAANITDTTGRARPDWAEPWTVIERGGQKIAVIGLALRATPTNTAPRNVAGLAFGDGADRDAVHRPGEPRPRAPEPDGALQGRHREPHQPGDCADQGRPAATGRRVRAGAADRGRDAQRRQGRGGDREQRRHPGRSRGGYRHLRRPLPGDAVPEPVAAPHGEGRRAAPGAGARGRGGAPGRACVGDRALVRPEAAPRAADREGHARGRQGDRGRPELHARRERFPRDGRQRLHDARWQPRGGRGRCRPRRLHPVPRRAAAADRRSGRRALAQEGRGRMMVEELRVFVNERAVRVARGATVQDAVAALDGDLAALLASDAAYVTDGVGRPVDAGGPVGEGGGIFRVVVTARRGPPRMSKEALRRWPKAELHVHLDGCLRPETMLELARAQGVRLPADTPDALKQALSVKGSRSLEEYLSKYEITLSVMQTAQALERIAYEFVRDVAAEHVRYVEVRYSPALHRPALTLTEAIEAPLAGIKRGEAETGTKVGVIVCGIRTRSPAESLELARAAAEYRTAGVVGFDLAGAERGYPARDHARAFAYAAQHGMACTCHAGEGDGPDSIRQALHDCGARRIGHGTRLGEDGPLLDYVVEHRVPLEMCLTSNLHTHTVPSLAAHPFKRYLDRGVVVTLNTDGRLVDGVSLSDEYFLAHAQGGLTQEELARVVLNACESAFLPEFEKVALVSRVQSELEAL